MSSNNDMNNINSSATDSQQEESNKRAALAGQWRTPPLPFFANSSFNSNNIAAKNEKTKSDALTQLPDSHEKYQQALQEAYRRGAEAAAAMAATTASAMTVVPTTENNSSGTPLPSPSVVVPMSLDSNTMQHHQPSQQQQQQQQYYSPTQQQQQTSPSMKQEQQQQQQQFIPNPLGAIDVSTMPPPPPVTTTASAATTSNVISSPVATSKPEVDSKTALQASTAGRSVSLPDMTTYAAQQEEDKRQKRLARNRASARLRRLRKKNLVDAYEAEVGILERTLQQLKTHEWGAQDNPTALAEALSMDRGQQVLDTSQRQEVASNVLKQQLQMVSMLEDLMSEQYVLYQVADENNHDFDDLKEQLNLSPDQIEALCALKTGWEEEWAALQTLKTSLTAMQDNHWLWNDGVSAVADQFLTILHKNQVSKFLLWTDHNSEAIDSLDGVNAPQSVPDGPVFSFGVDSHPEGTVDEEK